MDTCAIENLPLQELPCTVERIVHGRAVGLCSSGGVQSEKRHVFGIFISPKRVGLKLDFTDSGGRTW